MLQGLPDPPKQTHRELRGRGKDPHLVRINSNSSSFPVLPGLRHPLQ